MIWPRYRQGFVQERRPEESDKYTLKDTFSALAIIPEQCTGISTVLEGHTIGIRYSLLLLISRRFMGMYYQLRDLCQLPTNTWVSLSGEISTAAISHQSHSVLIQKY